MAINEFYAVTKLAHADKSNITTTNVDERDYLINATDETISFRYNNKINHLAVDSRTAPAVVAKSFGTTKNATTLNLAIADAVGSSYGRTTVIISGGEWNLDDDDVDTTGVVLQAEYGSFMSWTGSYTYTFGEIAAGLYKIFDCPTTNCPTITMSELPCEWFGLDKDSSNNQPAIQRTINSLPNDGGIIKIPAGEYPITTSIELRSFVQVCGTGRSTTFIKNNNILGADAIKNPKTEPLLQAVCLRDFGILGNSLSGNGISFDQVSYSDITNVLSQANGENGIYVTGNNSYGSYYNKFYNIDCNDNVLHGIYLYENCNATKIFGARINDNLICGIKIHYTTYLPNDIACFGVNFENNGSYGISINGTKCLVTGGRFENNNSGDSAVFIDTYGYNTTLIANAYFGVVPPAPLIESNIADGGAFSPTIIESQYGHRINTALLIDMSNIGVIQRLETLSFKTSGGDINYLKKLAFLNSGVAGDQTISYLKGLSMTSIPCRNLFVKNYVVPEGVTSVSVTLPYEEVDTGYFVIAITPNWITACGTGTKSTTACGIGFGTVSPANAKISLMIGR